MLCRVSLAGAQPLASASASCMAGDRRLSISVLVSLQQPLRILGREGNLSPRGAAELTEGLWSFMALLTHVWVCSQSVPVGPHTFFAGGPSHVATGGGNSRTALYSTGSRLRSQNALGTVARTEAGGRSVGLRRSGNHGAISSHPDTGSPRGPCGL